MNPIFKKSFVSGLLKETLRSGVIAALVMMPFGLFFKKMGLRMNEYGPKTIQLIFGDLQPGPQITFGIIEHFLISWMVAVPLLLVLLWTFKRISALLVGSLYGIVFYVIMNSLALPWFFGDPTPWQLGFETIYPSLLVHTIYGLSVALTSRAFVVRWTGQTRFSFTSHQPRQPGSESNVRFQQTRRFGMNSVILENIPITAEVTALSPQYSAEEREEIIDRIKRLIKEQDAVLVAHYYTDSDLQMIAEKTGGFVSDSLDMARFGQDHPASTLIVAGVRFMGETAKILSPEKRVLMPTLEATCSLDIGCPADEFKKFCADHPDRTVVVYANTSAEVKALSDWVVTSAIALEVAKYLKEKGVKILWAPDKHLGHYIQSVTGADMVLWQGSCVVHDEFREEGLKELLEKHPDAGVLVHPESPKKVIELADVVGSTSQLIKATQELPHKKFVVATDRGIFYKMKQAAPEKTLMESPTEGVDATCTSCAHCPWMAMNGLDNLVKVLETGRNEIEVAEELRLKALGATQRMMAFAKNRTIQVLGRSNA